MNSNPPFKSILSMLFHAKSCFPSSVPANPKLMFFSPIFPFLIYFCFYPHDLVEKKKLSREVIKCLFKTHWFVIKLSFFFLVFLGI